MSGAVEKTVEKTELKTSTHGDGGAIGVYVHEWTKETIEIELRGVHISVAATLVDMIQSVPMLAIDGIQVDMNNTCLNTYAMARTLEFVRLKCSEKFKDQLYFAGECPKCKNMECSSCAVQLEMHVESHVVDDTLRMVTSNDLKVEETRTDQVQICQPPQPIVEISRDQHIHLRACARKGLGFKHPKYSPTANNVSIWAPATVTVDKKLYQQLSKVEQETFRNSCPAHVLDDIENLQPQKCTKCHACVDMAEKILQQPTLVRIAEEPRYFLYIKAKPSIAPETIVRQALQALLTKLRSRSDVRSERSALSAS